MDERPLIDDLDRPPVLAPARERPRDLARAGVLTIFLWVFGFLGIAPALGEGGVEAAFVISVVGTLVMVGGNLAAHRRTELAGLTLVCALLVVLVG